ncbi:MAG: hypothetical protein AAAC47_19560 [Pararhizobium sp.]
MPHDYPRKSDPSVAGLLLCIIAAMAAIGLFLAAAHSIEEAKQTARVFVPATLSQTTAPK